jgi:ribonuclease Z
MKRVFVGFVVVVLVLGGAAYAFRARLVMALMQRTAARNLGAGLLEDLADGLHVALCGAGAPLADPDRSGPCVAVIAGGRLFVVDAGSGAGRNLTRMRLPPGRLEGVFLTHFHSDHIDGLGELMLLRWAGGAKATPTPVFGPEGVEQVVAGFNTAYAQDATYRVAHHGEAIVPKAGAGGIANPFVVPPDGESRTVLESEGLTVKAFRVEHSPVEPAIGYRFDYAGRSVVLSGDTKKSANLLRFAKGVDLLLHEALDPKLVGVLTAAATDVGAENVEKISVDILDYHTTPIEAAEIAQSAGTKALLFYHIVPPLPLGPLEELFLAGVAEAYSGEVILGRDGTMLSLPARSTEIDTDSLL